MKQALGYLVAVAFAVLMGTGLVSLYFWFEIPRTPTTPDPKNGLIFPFDNHGVTHYVNWFDNMLWSTVSVAIFLAVPIVIVFAIWARVPRRR